LFIIFRFISKYFEAMASKHWAEPEGDRALQPGGRKYMQDVFSVAYQQTEDVMDLEYACFAIFDGHGGKEAALFAKVSYRILL
jgi:hypothetical protein